ncbi:MAG: triple tyrosine motif-containing protein, partial [Verrucomicrobia bacterium]|nr:triple tyrosine motif-containing protein [Verrucomicrobiota bacterium]
ELAPGKRQVELHYTGLSFVSPDRVRFRYKLEGLDKDWVEAGTRRTAQYSFLRPGQYTFRVIACNNDGVWNAEGANLLLTVSPHFYETSWFAVLLWIAGAGLVVVFVRQVVVRKMRRQLEILERQRAVERDRTRIAKDIHYDLGAGLTHISLLTELARRTPPEEVNSHLGQISDMARELTKGMDEIVWAVDPQNDTLEGLLNYLCKFAQEYLAVAGIRCRLDLPAQMPVWAVRAEVRHNLFLAFKETLNNILKHAGATEVWLRAASRSDFVRARLGQPRKAAGLDWRAVRGDQPARPRDAHRDVRQSDGRPSPEMAIGRKHPKE